LVAGVQGALARVGVAGIGAFLTGAVPENIHVTLSSARALEAPTEVVSLPLCGAGEVDIKDAPFPRVEELPLAVLIQLQPRVQGLGSLLGFLLGFLLGQGWVRVLSLQPFLPLHRMVSLMVSLGLAPAPLLLLVARLPLTCFCLLLLCLQGLITVNPPT